MDSLHLEASRRLRQEQHSLAERIVATQYQLQPEVWQRFGAAGREKSLRDMEYHLSYLAEALAAAQPALFADYIAWVKVLFAGLKLPDQVLLTTLTCTRDLLRKAWPFKVAAVATQYIEQALARLPSLPTVLPTFLVPTLPLAALAQDYLQALLRGERQVASGLIMEAARQGTPVRDLYLHVFQPSQHEIGRLWQMNQLSVAQEHYCTAATQLIMSQLYPLIFASERVGHTLVAACVGGELHEIGVRMVADFFELAGWDTFYLGANMPTVSIVSTLAERRADVLAISATLTTHVGEVAELIAAVRATEHGAKVRVLVGGYPFNVAPDLWQSVGADGYAPDAQQAVQVAMDLMESRA
jgi:MerR family transcriptional regulator, light-induced transcriptional regulator